MYSVSERSRKNRTSVCTHSMMPNCPRRVKNSGPSGGPNTSEIIVVLRMSETTRPFTNAVRMQPESFRRLL